MQGRAWSKRFLRLLHKIMKNIIQFILQKISEYIENKKNNKKVFPETKPKKILESKIIQSLENLPEEERQDERKSILLDLTKDKDKAKIAEMANKYSLDVASVLAVAEVESEGKSGFQGTGLLTVLFEAHWFYKFLKQVSLDSDALMVQYPSLISPTWNRKLYKGGDYENSRLVEALKIHECAWNCASYGMF